MLTNTSIIRILFALLIGVGLCRQDWSHIHNPGVPESVSREQVLREATYGHDVVFAEVFSDLLGFRAHQNQSAGVPMVFELARPFSVTAPTLAVLASVTLDMPVVSGSHDECVKNKDPPV
ncbi:MAG TPA: hypothetical protein VIO38_04250 [Rariglobus sp.]